jgi:hypothetical protein
MSDSMIAGSTNVVELVGLQDTVTGLYPEDATVTCDILSNGVALAGAAGLAMPHVNGTTGADATYRGTVPATVALVVGKVYARRITAVGAGGTGTRVFTKEIVATDE